MPFLHRTVVGKARPSERNDTASLHIVCVLQKEKGMPELVNQGYKMKNYIIPLPEFDNWNTIISCYSLSYDHGTARDEPEPVHWKDLMQQMQISSM
jgi:hypothetical protein